jgi:hypothetical protein
VVIRSVASAAAGAGVVLAIAGTGWGPAAVLLAAGVLGLAVSLKPVGIHHVAVGGLLSALLLIDVSQAMPDDRHTRPQPRPGLDSQAVLERAPDTDTTFRYMDEFGISCRSGTRYRRRDFRGYQDPLLLKSYERVLASLQEFPRLAEVYGVRYALTGPHFIHGWNRHFLPPPWALLTIEGAADLGKGVVELPDALPVAFWVPMDRVGRSPDRPAVLERLKKLAPMPVAILDGAVQGAVDRPDPTGRIRGTARSVAASDFVLERDWLTFRIEAPGAGMVVVNEAWYPGWKATVDGNDVPIHRVNALVRAVYVEAGDHTVHMEFDPADGTPLRWLLLLTLGACGLVILGSTLVGKDEFAPEEARD